MARGHFLFKFFQGGNGLVYLPVNLEYVRGLDLFVYGFSQFPLISVHQQQRDRRLC